MTGDFALTLWTDDPGLARAADAAGVDRIGPDLERAGKRERQSGLGAWISEQRAEPLAEIAAGLENAQPFARIDPLGPGSGEQIEQVLGLGARVLMLPMFTTAAEVAEAQRLIAGRAHLVPLVETVPALDAIDDLLRLPGLSEVHMGINDLGLSLGFRNRFEVLLDDRVARFCRRVKGAGWRLGIGGLARPAESSLPLDPELVYALCAGLGADAALLARSFGDRESVREHLAEDVAALRERLRYWRQAPADLIAEARARAATEIAALESF